jgi:hypothetical protein
MRKKTLAKKTKTKTKNHHHHNQKGLEAGLKW